MAPPRSKLAASLSFALLLASAGCASPPAPSRVAPVAAPAPAPKSAETARLNVHMDDSWCATFHVDPAKAAASVGAFETGCRGGDAEGCFELYKLSVCGAGVPKDNARAEELERRACGLGRAASCHDVGTACFMDVQAHPGSAACAFDYFTKGCSGGELASCNNLATLYFKGAGTPVDVQHGADLLDLVCKRGGLEACVNLGALHAQGALAANDHPLAIEVLQKACDADIVMGCKVVARAYHRGDGVAKDDARALPFLEKACHLGAEDACKIAGDLRAAHGQ